MVFKKDTFNYLFGLLISDFSDNATDEQKDEFKKKYPGFNWEVGKSFAKTIEQHPENKTHVETTMSIIHEFMVEHNLIGEFDF